MQICSKRTVRQMEEFAIFVKFVNFGCHNNYFRPGPRLLYATCSSFKYDVRSLRRKQSAINPLHPKFPAERQAVSGRKNRVRLRSMPLPLRSLPGGQAWWGGRWMNSRRDGIHNNTIDLHKWPHPPKVGTKLTFGPFHSTTLTGLT